MTPGIHKILLEAMEKPDGFHLSISTVDGWWNTDLVLVRIVNDFLHVRSAVSAGSSDVFINIAHIVRFSIEWG